MKSLNLETFPLDGLTLIEASAGTGKTYALANLYLRYLLERQFTVEQILVVTFTEAATQELKDRIRRRIRELIDVFESHLHDQHALEKAGPTDPILTSMFAQSTEPAADQLRLKVAERQIDQAEIHTIHGFCQRLLREHALDSMVPLQQTLVEDPKPMLKQVAEDFWRGQVLALSDAEIEFVCHHWSGPESLLADILPILNRSPECLFPVPDSVGLAAWSALFKSSENWFARLKQETRAVIDEVSECVAQSGLKRVKDKLNWLAKIRDWCESDSTDFSFPSTSSKANLFAEFVPSSLAEQTKANAKVPEHSYFAFLADYLPSAQVALKEQFVAHSYLQLREAFHQQKQAQAVFGFDDLISQVATALDVDSSTRPRQQVEHFASTVRQRYRVALIDEFQDTDKAQYTIFSTLFGPKASENASRLVLIGDPKQAIYAFRGGDIAMYLKAKHEIVAHPRGELLTMDTNWRSDPAMIQSINCLFASHNTPFMADDIPFYPVRAGQALSELSTKAALSITQLEAGSMNKAQITQALAQDCVVRVLNLLGQNGPANTSGEMPVFKSDDIAILVRSGTEGELIKARLAEAGISASYEGKSRIFDAPEAQAIYFLLLAVAEPQNERAIWRCLAETLFGFKDWQFGGLKQQTQPLAEMLKTFDYLHQRWLRGGVLAMIREALGQLQVFAHWQEMGLDTTGGEWQRSLSNINQLAELLQQQSSVYRGHFALIRWLGDKIVGAEAADDESKQRLESDEKLVRIVTIHKSKGLEYSVVMLPFMFSGRAADRAWYYDPQGRLSLDLSGSEPNLARAESERLAEDMRLLYVALTRAKYRCYLGTSAYQGSGKGALGLAKSAWGHLLFDGTPPERLDDTALTEQLNACCAQAQGSIETRCLSASDIAQRLFDCQSESSSFSTSSGDDIPQHRVLSRAIEQHFRVQSFTGLMYEHHAQKLQPFSATEYSFFGGPASSRKTSDEMNILGFPKGSRAGTFLHTLFESVEFASAQPLPHLRFQYPSLELLIKQQLDLSKLVDSEMLSAWSDYLANWLRSVLGFPLMPGFSLSDLASTNYVAEMAFHFPVSGLNAHRFNALLTRFGRSASGVEFTSFKGQFKGAIDLVFKTNDQFFVLDYKSNYLGEQLGDYLSDGLQQAMDEHRYDIQYSLYTLAVHRYLKHRLGEAYDYQRDFGGVVYLFLRGLPLLAPNNINDENTPGVFFIKPASELIEALDVEVASP